MDRNYIFYCILLQKFIFLQQLSRFVPRDGTGCQNPILSHTVPYRPVPWKECPIDPYPGQEQDICPFVPRDKKKCLVGKQPQDKTGGNKIILKNDRKTEELGVVKNWGRAGSQNSEKIMYHNLKILTSTCLTILWCLHFAMHFFSRALDNVKSIFAQG